MRKSRFTETKIVSILRDTMPAPRSSNSVDGRGLHPNTISAWKSKCGGMESSEIARGPAIEDENTRMNASCEPLARERRDERAGRKNSWGPRSEKLRSGPFKNLA
jgi:putative transposase